MRLFATSIVIGLLAAPAFAQSAPTGQAASQPPSAGAVLVRIAQNAWAGAKRNIAESAHQMHEADYGAQPVAALRTFGRRAAHVAESNDYHCARAKGQPPGERGGTRVETGSTKAAIVRALGESVAYCVGVYASLTAASAARM